MATALEFRDVTIVFAPGKGRKREAAIDRAMTMIAEGADRPTISDATGVVLGVAHADLAVEQGRISVLMGLSGSGKSTLLRAANGLNPVTRGHVIVHGEQGEQDIASCGPATLRDIRRHRVAMVFQQFGLLPWRTVRENVALGLELRGDTKAAIANKVDEQLALVGLTDWAENYASELSGGMQQRVGLARAFATDADILLMDEPFSALDPLIRAKLQDDLLELQQAVNKTILFVSHDLDEAFKLGDQLTLLEGGRMVQSGTPKDIMLRPATPYVASFLEHMNPLHVVTGAMVMRPIESLPRDGDAWLLDDAGRYRMQGDSVTIEDEPVTVTSLPDPAGSGAPSSGLVRCPAATPVRDLMRIYGETGHPIILTRRGDVVGICDGQDILRGLGDVGGAG
ncbi:ATP-binding cassette domain-containing protein [Stakelama saccharophila]|uniref:ATP-binding cassette domain-containing protein n=1 Tax=Stakelama saccharophila TaxID=3075605 RepID=A0ABZ0B8L2_9SPHN|nr:ATP-binding cassette domain-containing protein [Stakelama sp. W311]WNO53765.1 ATP-binding cassette domain-containing protein [Stakelama sp. W311]